MSTRSDRFCLQARRSDSGIALVVTLALLVLVAVAVVAFMSRSTFNQQITTGSSNGVVTEVFTDGATQETVAGLQKEMWDLSGYSQPSAAATPSGVFPIRPLPTSVANRVQGIVPTIEVGPNVPQFPTDATTPRDPNKPYSQFANLIKQSYTGVPTYSGSSWDGSATTANNVPTVVGPKYASAILTSTPSLDGRLHDGTFWNQPQLTSVASTDTTNLGYLVPDWIYTARNGTHPIAYASNLEPSANGALNSTSVVGRYAYNVYDLGGLLNANVAGYGVGANAVPSYTTKDTMIVPGYKGSVLLADLSGLTLNGTLTVNGANSTTFAPSAQNTLPNFRYLQGQQNWATDLPKLFASGQYGGWLQPFLPALDPATTAVSTMPKPSGSTYLANGAFTSRQDLITWIDAQLGTGTNPAAWALPYLTHFSYDLDTPSYTPASNRPRDTAGLSAGGNDSTSALDDAINPAFTSVVDANSNPLIKHRFPLSALALLDNIYPGSNPAPPSDPASPLYKQIQYDFGLVWDSQYNCWDYKDMEGSSGAIKQLRTATNTGSNTVPVTRSPNFFELLKAAITTGSLGKQRGGGSYDADPDNTLGSARYGSTTYQVIQIGANIISQSTQNFFPTAICLFGNGQAPIIYGDKDLPYLYRSRLLTTSVGYFSGKAMLDNGAGGGKNSLLAAVFVQPELWNPHAPNLLSTASSGSNFPSGFRIVPRTGNVTPHTALGVSCYFGQNNGQNWAIGGTNPNISTSESNGIMTGDYTRMGGPDITKQISYDNTKPDASITFTSSADLLPSGAVPSPLGSFREPCPLAAPSSTAPSFPPNIGLTGTPSNAMLAAASGAVFSGLPNTTIVNSTAVGSGDAIPPRFTAAANTTSLGFLVGYYCAGPRNSTLSTMKNVTGGPMILDLQYGLNGQYYTYDTIQSAFPPNFTEVTPPSSTQQTETGVRTDPRTNRWGLVWHAPAYGTGVYGTSATPGTGQNDMQVGRTFAPASDLSANNYGTGGTQNLASAPGWSGTVKNSPVQLGWTQVNQIASGNYYQDPDGVVRSGDGAYVTIAGSTSASPIGLPMAMLAATNNTQSAGATNYDSRPVVLNRPFQSIAELGYVFRDTPWRSLDFFTPESGDAALLDVFSIYGPDPYSYSTSYSAEPTGIVAGKVNLNTRQQPVLGALLKGASTTTVFPSNTNTTLTTLTDAQSAAIAQALVQWTTTGTSNAAGPLLNPAELVGKYTGNGSTGYNGFSSTITTGLNPSGTASEVSIIKGQRECVMHALADAGSTRTWNLLIDLVAQTGQLATNATSLQNFVVNGEHHVWVSVALDRVTGKIIKMQVEPVRL